MVNYKNLLRFALGWKASDLLDRLDNSIPIGNDKEVVERFIISLLSADWDSGVEDLWFMDEFTNAAKLLDFDIKINKISTAETPYGSINLYEMGDCFVLEMEDSWEGGRTYEIL